MFCSLFVEKVSKRIEKADRYRLITTELLRADPGEIDWTEQVEGLGSAVRQITHRGDEFEPNFELDTDEHVVWVKKARSEFE